MHRGVVLIMLCMALTPFGDGLSKVLGQSQSPLFICFLRYFLAGLIAVGIARIRGHAIHVPRNQRVGIVVQTALVMGAMTLLITALSMVPLANAVGGFLIAPIVATLISVAVLGERLTQPKIIGSALSVVGAVLITQPNTGIDTGTLLALAGGVLLGLYLAATRATQQKTDGLSALVVQCLLGAAMIAPFAVLTAAPLDLSLVAVGFGLGGVTAACHFLTMAAYSRTEASVLAPFFYFNLVAAVAVGIIWFGEWPSALTMIGLAAIGVGGYVSLLTVQQLIALRARVLGLTSTISVFLARS